MSTDWRQRAACTDEDPELFFPVGYSGPARLQAAEAQAVCHRCPVRSECLTWALTMGLDDGVFGGMTEQERRMLRRREARKAGGGGADQRIDHVVVEHRLAGRPPGRKLRHVERVEVARRVLAANGGYNQVMRVLRCNGSVAGDLIAEARAIDAAEVAAS